MSTVNYQAVLIHWVDGVVGYRVSHYTLTNDTEDLQFESVSTHQRKKPGPSFNDVGRLSDEHSSAISYEDLLIHAPASRFEKRSLVLWLRAAFPHVTISISAAVKRYLDTGYQASTFISFDFLKKDTRYFMVLTDSKSLDKRLRRKTWWIRLQKIFQDDAVADELRFTEYFLDYIDDIVRKPEQKQREYHEPEIFGQKQAKDPHGLQPSSTKKLMRQGDTARSIVTDNRSAFHAGPESCTQLE
ncbi:uncharacterized protein BT62DRAFT_997872 [Guyanagaster necrorhizus]|uniref:Uncharacterized protein n=1 Tax=Guyanagaster necrorhizus TaxID=856835 RepID=A0A9P7VGS8_9AGAR|nr:uncharacterized protein BT62DRAFT_997872 [Guyanagaster necrorhizus MCA 3950]KAG7440288.1 hypothetical protein BT62DRAFT_997872 [Guyanagaster necrorhizus MCA 3950]